MSWLNEDFTKSDEADHILKECIAKKLVIHGSILQVTQCTNVSLPRKNKEAESTLTKSDPKNSVFKIALTDGKTTIYALSDSHPQLSSSTVPGTKIEIVQDIPIVSNFILLTSQNTKVLGGVVPALAEQWKMQLAAEKLKCWSFNRSTRASGEGPPPWKPFNKRGSAVDGASIRNVKAMDIVKEQESQKGEVDPLKSKFDAERQQAISELAKQNRAKSFGEGKKLIDKGVLDIVNEGFTEAEAEEALRKFKNPQKALKYLKGVVKSRESGIARLREAEKEKELIRGGRKSRKDREDDGPTGNEIGEQPSNTINLFGFIEAKIKKDLPNSTPAASAKNSTSETNNDNSRTYAPRSGGDRNSNSFRGGRGGDNSANNTNSTNDRHNSFRDRNAPKYPSSDSRGGGGRDGGGRLGKSASNDTSSNNNSFNKGFRSDRWDSLASQGNSDGHGRNDHHRGGGRGGGRGNDRGGGGYQQRNDSRYSGDRKQDRSNFASTIIKNNHGFSRPNTASQQDFPSINNHRQEQHSKSSGFDGLKSSNFPSLTDEPPNPPPQQQQQQNRASNNGYHMTQHQQPPPQQQQQQQYQNSDYQYHQQQQQQYPYQRRGDDNYGRSYQGDQQQQQQQRGGDGSYGGYRPQHSQPTLYQQNYQPPPQRNRGGYDQYESKRMPTSQQPPNDRWRPGQGSGGVPQQQQDHGYDQFNRQFSSLSMQQQQQQQHADYSRGGGGGDEWTRGQTMVFSRSKNNTTSTRNRY